MTIVLSLYLEQSNPFIAKNLGSIRIKGKEIVEFKKNSNFVILEFTNVEKLISKRRSYRYKLFDKYDNKKGGGELYINEWNFSIKPNWFKKQYLLFVNEDSWVYTKSTLISVWFPLFLSVFTAIIGALIGYFINPCN